MVKYKTILSAIDEYLIGNDIVKTHDGTSMKKIWDSINKFQEEYGQNRYEHVEFYNEKGKKIYHYTSNRVDSCGLPDTDYFDRPGNQNLHLMHNHPSNWHELEIGTCLSEGDTNNLLWKNNEGEYNFRSVTCSSPNGFTMTLLRSDNFSDENIEHFNKTCGELREAYSEYKQIYANIDNRKKINEYLESHPKYKDLSVDEIKIKLKHDYIKDNGTFSDYLKQKGIYDDFEKCNMKLRVREGEI